MTVAFANTSTTRIAGAVLIVGLVTGVLLAMATPTDMKRKGGTWREMIGVREVAVDDGAIPVYAPPQDLTPVQWQTAAQEYPPMSNQTTALDAIYPDSDAGYLADTANDALPPQIPEVDNTASSAAGLAAAGDDAISSALAASDAAMDVETQERTVVESTTTGAPAAIAGAV